MRSKVADRMMAKMPEDTKIFADKYADLLVLINQIINEKGYTQKSLAIKLEKNPSEIHRWLCGEHNFTLKSISKLEAELGETLLEVPVRKTMSTFKASYGKTTFKVYSNVSHKKKKAETWTNVIMNKTQLSNVG